MGKDKRARTKFEKWMKIFASLDEALCAEAIGEIEAELLNAQNVGYNTCLDMVSVLEAMLVCLLGHRMDDIRERAVILLNVLYDGHDLQINEALHVQISSVDEHNLEIRVPIRENATIPAPEHLRLKLFGPSRDLHSPPRWTEFSVQIEAKHVVCVIPSFPREGYYDWYIYDSANQGFQMRNGVAVAAGQSAEDSSMFETRKGKGRIIVHPARIRSEYFVETPVDQIGATWDESTGMLHDRGSFDSVLQQLPELKMRGITGVYIMGALERPLDDDEATPFNVADREQIASKLGGRRQFQNLVSEMQRLEMKPILDGFERVSRTSHRKYRKYIVETLNQRGVPTPHPGTDAHENQWSDSVLLNYRKVEVWDLMINEAKSLIREFGLKGIRLDNASSYPLILAADPILFRRDPDGELHYSLEEIFYGQIVIANAECSYWTTEACMDLNYPNPFLVKFVKEMWNEFPGFIVVGETSFHREVEMVQSGVVAQSMRIPQILASIAGRSLRKDGSVARIAANRRSTAKTLGRLYKNEKDYMPKNAIMIQETCSHTSPYPGGIFGRKAWLAADLMYFLPGIPMLLHGEDSGRVVRMNMMKLSNTEETSEYDVNYEALLPKSPPKRSAGPSSGKNSPADGLQVLSLDGGSTPKADRVGLRKVLSSQAMARSESQSKINQSPAAGVGMNRVGSKSLLARVGSASKLSRQGSQQELRSLKPSSSVSDFKSPIVRNRSKDDLKGIAVRNATAHDVRLLNELNRRLYEEIGPREGFDLAQIRGHYAHREHVRSETEVFHSGQFIVIGVEPLFRDQVFAFSRFTEKQIVLVVINMKDVQDGDQFRQGKHVNVFLQPLADVLPKSYSAALKKLYQFKDLFTGEKMDDNLYTLEEILFRRLTVHVNPLTTVLLEIAEVQSTPERLAQHMQQCVQRLQNEAGDMKDPRENSIASRIARAAALGIDSFGHALVEMYQVLKNANLNEGTVEHLLQLALQRASGLYYNVIYEGIEAPKDFDPPTGNRIVAFLLQLSMAAADPEIRRIARTTVKKCQKMGPIVFAAPEYGRFSTAGGLGVMVDELSKDLAELGLDVYVISPYYTVNRKNETRYLERDGFKWTRNLDINIGTSVVTCGVFEGKEDGVNLIFLERGDFFPKVYADTNNAEKHLQTIVLMSLGSLEACCQKGIAPAVFVTNDWLPSMAAGYAKQGFFGNFFDKTTFFHLIHNLGDGAYEGRVYPSPQQGDMGYIHRLPGGLLMDPWWAQKIVNPSRCALLCSDSWGTVSVSYLKELKATHPLKEILQKAKAPFAYPNGIRVAHREQLLYSKGAASHADAKRILQQKYFGFQDLDDSIPLFAFVGRITAQKGVHMMLNGVEELIRHTNRKIQFLVGGPANWSDNYSAGCARHMQDLRNKYSHCFWADPDGFFTDGPLVNLGADFGVMPSVFEPGGIVQQEFFVAGTPVVAFKTGGLRDTVHEWNAETGEGNGFTFENYQHNDYISAMQRAIRTFSRKPEYEQLRQSSYETVIDVSQVAWAWSSEFHRLQGAIFAVASGINQEVETAAKQKSSIYDPNTGLVEVTWKQSAYDVVIKGSFDGWDQNLPLTKIDSGVYKIIFRVPKGPMVFKFRVDGTWQLSSDYPKQQEGGFENNVVIVQ
eukprot:CAMPEP_0184697254 /NCGR_PEP_ID=MMETSP0313-20130426/4271_1 /TAXON_ID=2792 /ORGANISM="Porphyridium aerugineum, Strain SAG 1380-2" /LENGTH=1633 /DNA_ID=CAMNT_0027156019 /DNA_START=162 /DNA_END=5063 /DNA_ORIENTATION=+